MGIRTVSVSLAGMATLSIAIVGCGSGGTRTIYGAPAATSRGPASTPLGAQHSTTPSSTRAPQPVASPSPATTALAQPASVPGRYTLASSAPALISIMSIPDSHATVEGSVRQGTYIRPLCAALGEALVSGGNRSSLWYRVAEPEGSGYVNSVFLATGAGGPVTTSACPGVAAPPGRPGGPVANTAVTAYGQVRPSEFTYTGDSTGEIRNGVWSTWGGDTATGSGDSWVNDCQPTCATGSWQDDGPTNFTVSGISGGRYTDFRITSPQPAGYRTEFPIN